jgi:hypothetical protein
MMTKKKRRLLGNRVSNNVSQFFSIFKRRQERIDILISGKRTYFFLILSDGIHWFNSRNAFSALEILRQWRSVEALKKQSARRRSLCHGDTSRMAVGIVKISSLIHSQKSYLCSNTNWVVRKILTSSGEHAIQNAIAPSKS